MNAKEWAAFAGFKVTHLHTNVWIAEHQRFGTHRIVKRNGGYFVDGVLSDKWSHHVLMPVGITFNRRGRFPITTYLNYDGTLNVESRSDEDMKILGDDSDIRDMFLGVLHGAPVEPFQDRLIEIGFVF